MNADPFRRLPAPEDYAADLRVWVAASGAALPVRLPKPANEEKRNV
jgi:hypothetical protein